MLKFLNVIGIIKTLESNKPEFAKENKNSKTVFFTTEDLHFRPEWGSGTLSGVKIIKDVRGNIVGLDAYMQVQGLFGGPFRPSFLRITSKDLKKPLMKSPIIQALKIPGITAMRKKLKKMQKKKKLTDIEIRISEE